MNQPLALTLRPARVHEARAMAEMSRDLIEAGLTWRYTPPHMVALIREPETMALVACDGARIQGFAVMHFGDEQAHLALLCVRPALQQRGIGRRLNEWLIESARVAGIVSVRLELRADNAAALSFYRRLGFAETELVADYYDGRIAARRMTLALCARTP
jgi:ribosomal-protein-alanine N-acetyltransferase